MVGNGKEARTVGAPTKQIDDRKIKSPSYYIRSSLIDEIDKLAEKLGIPKSKLVEKFIEDGIKNAEFFVK